MSRLLISLMRLRLIQTMRLRRGIQALSSPITSRLRMAAQWKWSHSFGCLILSIGAWIDPKQSIEIAGEFFSTILIHLHSSIWQSRVYSWRPSDSSWIRALCLAKVYSNWLVWPRLLEYCLNCAWASWLYRAWHLHWPSSCGALSDLGAVQFMEEPTRGRIYGEIW